MKRIENSYRLDDIDTRLSADEIRKSLSDFEYFMSHYQQIVNKERQTKPFKLNAFQKMLFATLLPMIRTDTRLDKRHHVVVCKPRQVGASVGIVAFINYLCAFVDGMNNLNIAHVFPVGDTITKFYNQKVEPIISGVHPDLFPTIERETLSSSILTHYKDIKGIQRNNYYELISSNANSIRSSSIHVLLEDEVAFYSHPEQLDSAIMPALPAYGFSLVVYLSTFEDRKSHYFQEKILTAQQNPEDWTLIFVPWYMMYPERPQGLDVDDVYLTEEEDIRYRDEVIIPNLIKDDVPKSRWGDCIDWYFKQKRAVPNVKMEFPTTIEEVLTMHAAKKVFSQSSIDEQKKNILDGDYYRLVEDPITRKVEAKKEEDPTPFRIFRPPVYGRRYMLVADPITAMNEDTDIFAMMVFDTSNNEQVAVFAGRDYPVEDYASFAVNIAKIYNNAVICPESNVADALIACIRASGYYYFYYPNQSARARRDPGIRTTASSKPDMIDKLTLLLDNNRIILHDRDTIEQLEYFEKTVKDKRDGGVSVKMAARAGKHDDFVACGWIYAATLDDQQLTGRRRSGFAFL